MPVLQTCGYYSRATRLGNVIRKVRGFRITHILAKDIGVLLAETSKADARAEGSGDYLAEVGSFARTAFRGGRRTLRSGRASLGKGRLLSLYPRSSSGWVGEKAPLPPKKQEKLRDEGP